MNTIGKRIKEVREHYKLNQREFANTLGLQWNSISLFENGKRNPSERTLNDICTKYNTNPEWLINGNEVENKFIEPNRVTLDEYAEQKKATEFDKELFKIFLDIEPDIRREITDKLKQVVLKLAISESNNSAEYAQDNVDDIEIELIKYRKELEAEKKGKILQVSAGFDDSTKAN